MNIQNIIFVFTFIFLSLGFLNAQKMNKFQAREAIKSMSGCYEVSFNFIETFNYSKDSAYIASREKHDKGFECIQLVKNEDDKIVMQHLLITGGLDKPYIIKHWREDWLFENTDFYFYDSENKWKYIKKTKDEVAGQWTQKVFQVDDSPRYEGSGSWVQVDGKTYWESTAYAPLPRREYTKRNDYNLVLRRNRHELIDNGWVHDQYNDKIIRQRAKKDILLAQEKGYNEYKRVDNPRCKFAQNWWKEHEDMWRVVRDNWEDIFARNQDLKLKNKVNDKRLYEYLFDLKPSSKNEKIKSVIYSFID